MKSLEIDYSNGIPVWVQVKHGLLHLIMSGYFLPGEQLPTVRQLAVQLSINYNTVSKVYMDLEREGFIVTKRGKGTFVVEREPLEKHNMPLMQGLVDNFLQKAFSAGMTADDILEVIQERLTKFERKREDV